MKPSQIWACYRCLCRAEGEAPGTIPLDLVGYVEPDDPDTRCLSCDARPSDRARQLAATRQQTNALERLRASIDAERKASSAPSDPRHPATSEPLGLRNQTSALRLVGEVKGEHRASPGPPPASVDAALRAVLREEVRAHTLAALAEHGLRERRDEQKKTIPIAEASRNLNITQKAMRSRIERGSVPGAHKIGDRWYVPWPMSP